MMAVTMDDDPRGRHDTASRPELAQVVVDVAVGHGGVRNRLQPHPHARLLDLPSG
jgi:hypothetical protein